MSASSDYLHKLFGLDDQVGVVIGGTGVLGSALSHGLARAGSQVVVAGRSQQRGEQTVDSIRRDGGQASFEPVDVTSRESVQSLLDTTLQRHDRVDMLINCAGANSASPYLEVEDADWQRVMETNLTATHISCQIFAAHMASSDRGGSILNIGSVTACAPLSRVFAYSASKAAVVNLSQNLAREFGTRNVRVNVLCPGFFPAEQNRQILTQERTEKIFAQTPMGRFGDPHELVGCVLLLLSRTAGSFITGADYYVDGGFTAMRL